MFIPTSGAETFVIDFHAIWIIGQDTAISIQIVHVDLVTDETYCLISKSLGASQATLSTLSGNIS
jgi:hypothetical protein